MFGHFNRIALPTLALVWIVAWSGSRASAQEAAPDSLVQALKKAERILVAFSEEDLDVAPGKPFLVEIERSLRGTGARGSRARINAAAEEGKSTKYKGRRLHVLLLVKGPGGKGWANLGTEVLEVQKGKARWLVEGKPPYELTVPQLEELVEQTATAPEADTPKRETLQGRWLVYYSERGTDHAAWLVDFQPDPQGGFTTKMLEGSLESSTLKSQHVESPEIAMEFVANSVDFKFRGRFANGAVRGMMQAGKGNIVPAWMTATDVETLDRYRKPRATTGHSELIDAVGQEEPLADLLRFARRYKEQPAALEAYLALLPLLVGDAKSVDTLRPVLEAYVASGASWGPELAMRAEIDSALALAKAGGYPELGLEYIERAAPKINAESPAIWGMIVRRIRGQLLLEVGREDEGIEQLRIARGDNAFDPEITWLLSQHAQKNDKLEEALELLGELVAMPGLEGAILNIVAHGELSQGKKPPPQLVPSRLVERTWKLLKKPEGGVPKFLDEVYERKIHALAGERRPPRGEKEGNRVVLVELYTGAQCPPCVAADVATTALESTYSQSEVIVLRFHQHTPGPDPLANPDTLKRFAYYQGDSTPTLFLNGRNVDSVGGLLPAVPALLARLRSLVDPFLEEQIDLRLELSAVAKGNDVEIRAKGVGLPKFPAEVKLRLALAEEKIAMPAKNGIRIHDMVARKMPGEVDGISPNDGKLEFQETIDIAAFRTRIRGYLEHLEKETGEKFDRKPAEMTRLVLVGWLQNDDTGEVLQAAAVPVEGMLDPPAAVEAAVEPGEKKKPATDKKP